MKLKIKSYLILKFIDSGSSMSTLLPNLFDNLAEGIHEIKCKNEYDDKKFETHGINYKNESAALSTRTLKMTWWYKNVGIVTGITKKKFNVYLKKQFANKYVFCNCNINKFIFYAMKMFLWMHRWLEKI